MSHRILVTGPSLHEKAVAYLDGEGCAVKYVAPYTAPEALAAIVAEFDPHALLVRMGQVDAGVIGAGPALAVIAKHGVGVDNIDIDAATRRGVPVITATNANSRSVAEHAMGLMIDAFKRVTYLDGRVREGHWDKPSYVGRELRGLDLGLVGFGAIARDLARLAEAFEMRITAYDPYSDDATLAEHGVARAGELDALFSHSDAISLHCPLTDATRGLVDARRLSLMKPDAVVVNTARGGLVDEAALVAALQAGRLGGAGLDTFAVEPTGADNPLWALSNVVATPHVGGVTDRAVERMSLDAATGIVETLNGRRPEPGRCVNAEAFDAVARS